MDKIFINNLELKTIIGVHDWEKNTPQALLLDIEIETDISGAALSDNIGKTIDYTEIVDLIKKILSAKQFELLESLGEYITAELLRNDMVLQVWLRISKPGAIPEAKAAGIEITRGRQANV